MYKISHIIMLGCYWMTLLHLHDYEIKYEMFAAELKMVQLIYCSFFYSVKSGSQENYSDKQNKRLGLVGLL